MNTFDRNSTMEPDSETNAETGAQTHDGEPFFKAGGTIGDDVRSYVVRNADQELLASLKECEYSYILTTRQMGKSSLVRRVRRELEEWQSHGGPTCWTVLLDLTEVGINVSREEWYSGLLYQFTQQTGSSQLVDSLTETLGQIGPSARFFETLRGVAVKNPERLIYLFVDEIELTRNLPFAPDEFFAGIRTLYNRRADQQELRKITFCFVGVASPTDLIANPQITPFNVGRRIQLEDFERNSPGITVLEEGLTRADNGRSSRSIAEAKTLLDRVFDWSHGQPYLTQKLCLELSKLPADARPDSIDALCETLFLNSAATRSDDNIMYIRDRMLRTEREALRETLDIYLRIRRPWKRVAFEPANPHHSLLFLAGLIRVRRGSNGMPDFGEVRNRIYSRVFSRRWVRLNRPPASWQQRILSLLKANAIFLLLVTLALSVTIFLGLEQRAVKVTTERNSATNDVANLKTELQQVNSALRETNKLNSVELEHSIQDRRRLTDELEKFRGIDSTNRAALADRDLTIGNLKTSLRAKEDELSAMMHDLHTMTNRVVGLENDLNQKHRDYQVLVDALSQATNNGLAAAQAWLVGLTPRVLPPAKLPQELETAAKFAPPDAIGSLLDQVRTNQGVTWPTNLKNQLVKLRAIVALRKDDVDLSRALLSPDRATNELPSPAVNPN